LEIMKMILEKMKMTKCVFCDKDSNLHNEYELKYCCDKARRILELNK